jgi:hypothetical protein
MSYSNIEREISIKQMASKDHRRKKLSIVEFIHKDGTLARAQKNFSYFVAEQDPFENQDQMSHWLAQHPHVTDHSDRHISIRKTFDEKSGEGEMAYRVTGSFYVVQNLHLFIVVFLHSIRFDMLTPGQPAQHF